MNCLCGHFEWCEHCTPKPKTPEQIRAEAKLAASGWGMPLDLTQTAEEREKDEKVFAAARRFRRALNTAMDDELRKFFGSKS